MTETPDDEFSVDAHRKLDIILEQVSQINGNMRFMSEQMMTIAMGLSQRLGALESVVTQLSSDMKRHVEDQH